METTLCLIKPDGVRRGLVGSILARFERLGLKITALKLVQPTPELAGAHYTYEDIAVRHGEAVRNNLIRFITSGPVVAFLVEGDGAIEVVRKVCGSTEPLKSPPAPFEAIFLTIPSLWQKTPGEAIRNLIHASANAEDAEREVALWFSPEERCTYRRADQEEHFFDTSE